MRNQEVSTIEQEKSKNTFRLLDAVMIALFAALAYVAVWVLRIPVGPMFVHLGNLTVVTAALLLGGWQGGLAGAIGMGLFDLMNGYASTAPKTIILKFMIGLITGLVYAALRRRKKFPTIPLVALGIVALVAAGCITTYVLTGAGFSFLTALMVILSAVIGLLCLLFAFLGARMNHKLAAAVVGASCGMVFNLLGEAAYEFVSQLLLGSAFGTAVTMAVTSQASTLINVLISVIGGVALFLPLEKPFSKIVPRR